MPIVPNDPFGASRVGKRPLAHLDARVAYPPSQATRVFFVPGGRRVASLLAP
jgi:hypothetical protein